MLSEQFGQYLLLEPLGCGGMAEVYLAKTVGVSGFEKLLAIKRLLPGCGEDQHFIDLLADEARIAVQLDHPNIVQVFDFGQMHETYYIAMEYVEGVDLKALVGGTSTSSTALPVDLALHITISILDGLAFAHDRTGEDGHPLGIIHRDVTPHNVLISRHGQVKLTDFGVARAKISQHVSLVGDIRGKFSYMPPEQVCGGELDHRVDIFAAGAILYELLSGRQPFRSANFSEQMRLLTRDIPPPSRLVQNLPRALDALTLKALNMDPEKRYASARAFAEALREDSARRYGSGTGPTVQKLAETVRQRLEAKAASHGSVSEVMKRADYDATSGNSLIRLPQSRTHDPQLVEGETTEPTARTPIEARATRTEVMDLAQLAQLARAAHSTQREEALTPSVFAAKTPRRVGPLERGHSISGEIRNSAPGRALAATAKHIVDPRIWLVDQPHGAPIARADSDPASVDEPTHRRADGRRADAGGQRLPVGGSRTLRQQILWTALGALATGIGASIILLLLWRC